MELEIKQTRRKGLSLIEKKQSRSIRLIKVEGLSLQHLFANSLKGLAQMLRHDICDTATHFDCVMELKVSAKNYKELLITFLTNVLQLTHKQKAIFCTMYISECSHNKIVANLFGVWFDHFDVDVKSVLAKQCIMQRNCDSSYHGSLAFKLKNPVV